MILRAQGRRERRPLGADAKCDAGYYCSSGAFDSQGAYCIDLDVYVASYDPATDSNVTYDGNATGYPEPCPIGTFYGGTLLTGDCDTCSPGAACDTTGLGGAERGLRLRGIQIFNPTSISLISTQVCAGGYFCRNANEGAPSTTPLCLDDACAGDYGLCPAGSSCANGTPEPAARAAGTYGPTGLDACLACPAGRMCNGTNTTHYADCPGAASARRARARRRSPARRAATLTNLAADCAPCPEGRHCPEPGLVAPGPPCDAGFVCEIGSVHANGTALAARRGAARAGGYCALARRRDAVPRPNGTFSNATRLQAAAECTPCLPGHFCNDTGLEAPAGTCAPGHFCTEGAIVAAPDHTW
ncbi:dihydrolipoyllysine-residue acetyltransferase [Aureococcus anophagefferens]|nr:dihydrolipoyllysine-residue acetyltransferase [Aureococcus anophagefferens]